LIRIGELSFKPGGNKYYVRHLDKSFFLKKLHKANIFTDEILEIMNPIVNDYFRFKSMDEIEETEKEFNKTINDADDDDDTDGFSDATDAEDLFG